VPDSETYDLSFYNNNPVVPGNNTTGLWQSLLMLNYALENTVLLAAQGFSDYSTYIDQIIEQYTRCFQVYGGAGLVADTNRVLGPQVVSGNAGANWTQLTLSDMQVYANSRGNYLASVTSVGQYDPRFMIVTTRAFNCVKIAADKGRISATTGTKAINLYNNLQTAVSGVTNGSLQQTYSYGNYFGVPASLVSQMT
jgi:hypothetical protein